MDQSILKRKALKWYDFIQNSKKFVALGSLPRFSLKLYIKSMRGFSFSLFHTAILSSWDWVQDLEIQRNAHTSLCLGPLHLGDLTMYFKQQKADGVENPFQCSSFLIPCLNIHISVVFIQSVNHNSWEHTIAHGASLWKHRIKWKRNLKFIWVITSRIGQKQQKKDLKRFSMNYGKNFTQLLKLSPTWSEKAKHCYGCLFITILSHQCLCDLPGQVTQAYLICPLGCLNCPGHTIYVSSIRSLPWGKGILFLPNPRL